MTAKPDRKRASWTQSILPAVMTAALLMPLFTVRLKRPDCSETPRETNGAAELVDVSSALNDPEMPGIIANIRAWVDLRRPDRLVAPDAETGFLSVLPSSIAVPDASMGFPAMYACRMKDFGESPFSGNPLPALRVAPRPPLVKSSDQLSVRSVPIRRRWMPDLAANAAVLPPMSALPPRRTGVVWTDEAGSPLVEQPAMQLPSEADRRKATITRLELMPERELAIPRIVVRNSCGVPALDVRAVAALRAALPPNPHPCILNVIWNLK